MLRVLIVFGTRPEAIKLAPVIHEMHSRTAEIQAIVCSTGQHRHMLDQVMSLFALRPDIELSVMQPDQTLANLSGILFAELDKVITKCSPDWVIAQGDTTTVMVAALCAYFRRVRFGHVEAGLRTRDKWKPFPEEVNRRVADLVADAYFAPTPLARDELLRESCDPHAIHVTGNTVIDALTHVASRPFEWASSPLSQVPDNHRLVTVTAHRRESFGEPFRELCLAIRDLAEKHSSDTHFVYPVHLNPNVRRPVQELLGGLTNVSLLEPLDYLSLVQLLKRSVLVLTDSGGIQEEAPTFKVPVLVIRDTTERPEGLQAGIVRLVGTARGTIVEEAHRLLISEEARRRMTCHGSPYGDGRASRRIIDVLIGLPTDEFTPAQ